MERGEHTGDEEEGLLSKLASAGSPLVSAATPSTQRGTQRCIHPWRCETPSWKSAFVAAMLCLLVVLSIACTTLPGQRFADSPSASHSFKGAGGSVHVDHVLAGTATSGTTFSGKPFRQVSRNASALLDRARKSDQGVPSRPECSTSRPFAAVVTTIAKEATEAVASLAVARPDVDIFVVADKEGPVSWTGVPSNVHYLTVQHQSENVFGHFEPPWNHFGRKNYGYLAALQAGACFIWDFDDDNVLLDGSHGLLNSTDLRSWAGKAVQLSPGGEATTPWINHLPLMGATSFIWPRGTPLEQVQDAGTFLPRVTVPEPCFRQGAESAGCIPVGAKCSCLGILSSLAQGNPDLDAVQRLTGPAPVDFEHKLGVLGILGPGTTVSHNAQATLLSRDVVLFAMLPMTVHGRVADIWRALIANRIAEVAGLAVAVTSGAVVHHRNPHNYLADLDAEQPLYAQAGVLGRLLQEWKPRAPSNVANAALDLYVFLYERGVLEERDVLWAGEWVQAVQGITGPAPALFPPTSTIGRVAREKPLLEGVTAVVHINFGHLHVIPAWLSVWDGVFSDVVFYAPGAQECTVPGLPRGAGVRVVCEVGIRPAAVPSALGSVRWPDGWRTAGEVDGGHQSYSTLLHAMTHEATPSRGFLFLHDDSAVNVQLMQKRLANKPGVLFCHEGGWSYFTFSPQKNVTTLTEAGKAWSWASYPSGLAALNSAAAASATVRAALHRCHARKGAIPMGACDSHFWPSPLDPEAVQLFVDLLAHKVSLEISVPIVALCRSSDLPTGHNSLEVWSSARQDPVAVMSSFKPNKHVFVHPLKLGRSTGLWAQTRVRDGQVG